MKDSCLKGLVEAIVPYLMPYIGNKVKDEMANYSSPVSDEECLLTKNQVINRYQISAMSLWRMEQNGELIPVRIGRKVMYRPSDVEKVFK